MRTPDFSLTPIGVVHSPFEERVAAPRQPSAEGAAQVEGVVELFAGRGFEDALCDIETWDHVWLVVWFDRNRGFRPKVTPPRSEGKRGLFATRSPHRPNPIGLSAVRLVRVEGLRLTVRGLDLLDGTPLLDLKPYVPYSDAIPDANHGWLDEAARAQLQGRPVDPIQRFEVAFSALAEEQLAYLLSEHRVDLRARLEAQLALGPRPHAYRRIKEDGAYLRLALKDWRAWFQVEQRVITVERVGTGYKPRELYTPEGSAPPEHRAFVVRFSDAAPRR